MSGNQESHGILEEINEELKHEQLMAFLNKHRRVVFGVIATIVVGIFIHSSWYSRKKKLMEETSSALVDIIQNSHSRNDLMLSGLLENAPAEMRPILSIMKSGGNLQSRTEMEKNGDILLSLSRKHGVDIIWKDLAILIYSSYRLKKPEELVKILNPLAADDRPFRFSALEMIGMIQEFDGKNTEAIECFKKILAHAEAPATIKKRISVLCQHIKNKRSSIDKKNREKK